MSAIDFLLLTSELWGQEGHGDQTCPTPPMLDGFVDAIASWILEFLLPYTSLAAGVLAWSARGATLCNSQTSGGSFPHPLLAYQPMLHACLTSNGPSCSSQ